MGRFYFDSNSRCLDFINTELVERDRRIDRLDDFGRLVDWLREARFISKDEAARVLARYHDPGERRRILAEILGVRQLIRQIVDKTVTGQTMAPEEIDRVNTLLMRRRGGLQLMVEGADYRLKPRIDMEEPVNLILPVLESLCRLLSARDHSRLKKCRNPACIHYFFDTSKNQSRRWCRMTVCGNRMKAAAYYQRAKQREAFQAGEYRTSARAKDGGL